MTDQADNYSEWIGDAVRVVALDWQLYVDATDKDTEFKPMQIGVYGVLVASGNDSIAIAPQVYQDGRMRCVQCIPIACILEIEAFP